MAERLCFAFSKQDLSSPKSRLVPRDQVIAHYRENREFQPLKLTDPSHDTLLFYLCASIYMSEKNSSNETSNSLTLAISLYYFRPRKDVILSLVRVKLV